eukprot:scaffold14.g1046.t1
MLRALQAARHLGGARGIAASAQAGAAVRAVGAAAGASADAAAPPAPDSLDFPGGRVPFTHELVPAGGPAAPRAPMPCYQVINTRGEAVAGAAVPHPLDDATALRIYGTMVSLQTVDMIFYEAQRQLPHAVGAAYALKLSGARACAAVYFGEGAASEGDFHASLNFAATLGCPAIFICRNNGWAISTPATEQYRGDGIAGRGPSYGIATIRVDGGDALAVYNACAAARRLAVEGRAPVLVEAMSYRSGHHSTYRAAEEMRRWRSRDPVTRFRLWLTAQGWWDEGREVEARQAARKEVMVALKKSAHEPKPDLSELFNDVYDELPWHLREQKAALFEHVARHPGACPADIPVR